MLDSIVTHWLYFTLCGAAFVAMLAALVLELTSPERRRKAQRRASRKARAKRLRALSGEIAQARRNMRDLKSRHARLDADMRKRLAALPWY